MSAFCGNYEQPLCDAVHTRFPVFRLLSSRAGSSAMSVERMVAQSSLSEKQTVTRLISQQILQLSRDRFCRHLPVQRYWASRVALVRDFIRHPSGGHFGRDAMVSFTGLLQS